MLQRIVVALVFSIGLIQSVYAEGFLLKTPPIISKIEFDEKIDTLTMSMTWGGKSVKTGSSYAFGFDHKYGKTLFKIQIVGSLPVELTKEELAKFIKSTDGNAVIWTCVFGASDSPVSDEKKPASVEAAMGMVAKPLVVSKGTPRIAFVSEIVPLIHNKKVVFYTGAGISAGVVPTMSQLERDLGFDLFREDKTRDFLTAVQMALEEPESFIKVMDGFYRACFHGKPTPAHEAIRNIVMLKNWGVLTENLDLLHQRSGINPLNHNMSHWLKANVSPEDLKKIDVVMTVGLASDESGFLAWYKHHNPKGIIIAINLEKPLYLNNQDILISGDAKMILPVLFEGLKDR